MFYDGEDRFFGKIVAQLAGRDRLCAFRRQIAESTAALFYRNTVLLQQRIEKLIQRFGFLQRCSDLLTQNLFVRFKLRLLRLFTVCDPLGVFFVELFLPLLLRPVLAFCDSVLAAVEQINLIQTLALTHLHHFRTQVAERGCGAAVLHAGKRVAGFVHVRHHGNAFNAQTVDDNVHMDVTAFVVTVRVCADQSLMAWEMLFAKIESKLLCPIHRQSVFFRIPRIKTDDVVMGLHIAAGEVFVIGKIGFHAGNGKIFVTAENGIDAVILSGNEMTVSIQDRLVAALLLLSSC